MELCPNRKNTWVQELRGESSVALLTITPCKPLREFVLPFSQTLDSVGLEVLVSKGRKPPLGNTAKV